LEALGLSPRCQKIFEELVKRPDGIVLVTGPTGSGKTTSLYAALQKIDCLTKHVLTAEDPAEHQIEGVVQTEINVKAGVTFPVILRSMLREDPDVIMVGEIRDKETAEISLRAAMTGHLVLSTLHTNTAVGAIARLNDIGLDTYLVASTLRGVMAQRLVRRLCQNCKFEMPIAEAQARVLGFKGQGLVGFAGKGCTQCNGAGFHGRLGLFEIVVVDDEFRILIGNRAPEVRLQEKASALGSKTILEDGIEKIAAGLTTVEEVLRVCWRQ
jgi:type II secretory ATPase GspE/PulE/Tfp pilus assembly ATPase PilB-like protein